MRRQRLRLTEASRSQGAVRPATASTGREEAGGQQASLCLQLRPAPRPWTLALGTVGGQGDWFQALCCPNSHPSIPSPRTQAAPRGPDGCSGESVLRDLWLLSVPDSGPLWEGTALCPRTRHWATHTARALPPKPTHTRARAGITTFSPTRAQGFAGRSPRLALPPLPESSAHPPSPHRKCHGWSFFPSDTDTQAWKTVEWTLHVLRIHARPSGQRSPGSPTGRHWTAKHHLHKH